MASKKPTKEHRGDDLTQFLEQILPKGGSGKGRAPQLAESFQQDTFRELTRKVLVSPFEVYLYPTEPDGDAAVEAAAAFDAVTALHLGQAAMWHAVARLLGESRERTKEQVNRIFFYFSMRFLLECAPVLIGRRGTALRKPEQLAAVIDRLEKKYWSELPEMQGRPGRRGKKASELPAQTFEEVEALKQGFSKLRSLVWRPYRQSFAESGWFSGQALASILDPDKFTDAVGREARSKLKEFMERAGYPAHLLAMPGLRIILESLLRAPPTEAALRFQMLKAFLRYDCTPTYREMYDAYLAWKRGA